MSSGITPPPPPPPSQMPYGYVPPPELLQGPGARPRKRRGWVIALSIVGGLILVIALLVAGILTAIFSALRSSEPYRHATSVAMHDPRVAAALGTPVTTKWSFSGNISVSNSSGNTDLEIPVSGSRKQGTVYVVAKKSAGHWSYQKLELEVDGQEGRVDLLSQSNSQPAEK